MLLKLRVYLELQGHACKMIHAIILYRYTCEMAINYHAKLPLHVCVALYNRLSKATVGNCVQSIAQYSFFVAAIRPYRQALSLPLKCCTTHLHRQKCCPREALLLWAPMECSIYRSVFMHNIYIYRIYLYSITDSLANGY